jgi:hypothetical protein
VEATGKRGEIENILTIPPNYFINLKLIFSLGHVLYLWPRFDVCRSLYILRDVIKLEQIMQFTNRDESPETEITHTTYATVSYILSSYGTQTSWAKKPVQT